MNEAVSLGDVVHKIVDQWAWWRSALKDPAQIGKGLPVHDGDAQVGYFRTRNKDKTWGDPVAIYYPEDSETLVALRGDREVRPEDIWTWCCKFPVEYQAYLDARQGKGWPDDVAKVMPAPPAVGDNSEASDPVEALKDQIDAALKGAEAFKKITDDETLAKAQSLRSRLNELSNAADKEREAQKKPHLEAGKKVDAVWQPLVKGAKAGADQIRDAMGAWETEKLRRLREEARQREEELRKQQEAARAAEPAGELVEAAAPVMEAAPAPAPIKGAYGKAASVSVKVVVDEVTDWLALARYMIDHPDLKALLRNLAQRALDAGRQDVPGITLTEQAQVR